MGQKEYEFLPTLTYMRILTKEKRGSLLLSLFLWRQALIVTGGIDLNEENEAEHGAYLVAARHILRAEKPS